MVAHHHLQYFKRIPLLRPLLAMAAGIIIQFHLQPNLLFVAIIGLFAITLILVFGCLNNYLQFTYIAFSGIGFILLFICIGCFLLFCKNVANNQQSASQLPNTNLPVLLTLQEQITEKTKSFKTVARADAVWRNSEWQPLNGNVLLYFKKEDGMPALQYGSQLIVQKPLQVIGNAGNPGSFNYREYCLFQGIVRQSFLGVKDYTILATKQTSFLDTWLIKGRTTMLAVLKNNIKEPQQLSVAEALLIGYRDDLDRDLVQAYSNTGVVHIIAISGLHLGMIYGLLVLLFKPFSKWKLIKIIKPLTILFVLWGFSFIAGAVPSILRSAVMFSFIVIGESFGKRSNIYNNLAASAFVLLVFNPFSLWDVGFQLSYAAVLSIVLFSKHINNWFYFKNKLLKAIWSLNAVTLSAQILTLPLVLYHFHQFPVLFLVTNLIAVPLSGFVLYAELLMLVFAWWNDAVQFFGTITGWLISVLNDFIQHINNLPFSLWPHLQINISQAILLFILLAFFSAWLLQKKTKVLLAGLTATVLFLFIRCVDFIKREQQQKIIIYNVPQHKAIDILWGRNYQFMGDSILTEDSFLRNFHLQPSRILHRISPAVLTDISIQTNYIQSAEKTILLVNPSFFFKKALSDRIKADVVIISGNPKLYINQLIKSIDCNIIVADASNPLWKINRWKKDAEQLHLRLHSIPEQGAFEMNL